MWVPLDFAQAIQAAIETTTQTTTTPFFGKLIDLAVDTVPKILRAIGILLITRFCIGLTGRVSRRLLYQVESTLRKFFVQVAEFSVLGVGAIAALNEVGFQTASLVAVIGAASLAIGLALQNTLSHFAAGVMLISFRPFEAGDLIEGAGVAGVVDSIGIFSTTILTPDNVKITVPNGNLFSGTVKNLTTMGTRRVDINVDIADRPIEATIDRLLSLVAPHPLILDQPKLTCHVASISREGTVLSLRPWCSVEVYEQVRSEVQQLVQEALYENGSAGSVSG